MPFDGVVSVQAVGSREVAQRRIIERTCPNFGFFILEVFFPGCIGGTLNEVG